MKQLAKFAVLIVILLCSVRVCKSAIGGDRLVFHVPITYKNVHTTQTRIKPVHHRTYQKTDYKVLGYSTADKYHGGHGGMPMDSMTPMDLYLAKMQILRG